MKNSIKTALLFLLAGFLFGACEKEDGGAAETPLPAGAVEVRGTLIDIRTFAAGKEAFPQQSDYIFDSDIETLFDTPLSYATGLLKARGAEAFRCGSAQTVYMATTSSGLNAAGWSATEKSFTVNDLTYHLYSYVCRTPGQWIEIPDPADREYATMLFAETLSVACDPVPGTVVAQVPELRGSTVSNASIAILPNGNYVASCTGVTDGAALFVSKDRGATWSLLVENVTALNHIRNYYNLFVFEGALYMMGAGAGNQNLLISRSEDNGVTWTEPTDATNGVLLTGGFHSAAVPVVVYDGRLWRACETAGSDTSIKRPFVISAPVDADLLDASSWTKSDNLITDNEMIVNEKTVTELIEGNMVATSDGLYNILRASSRQTSQLAAKVTVTSPSKLTFSVSNDFITFPGGGKKFTIRYDEQSRRYWTLSNPAASKYVGMKNDGLYLNGITRDLIRNRLVLCYSTDLITWVPYKVVLENEDPFFHGFQYVDWQFDGSDLVAVCRMACPERRGLPYRQHDANILSFLRIADFRNL